MKGALTCPLLIGSLHSKVAGQLKYFIDSENYLVSSLFCLFEITQIGHTFDVIDTAGRHVTDQALAAWLEGVTLYFGPLKG